MNKFLFKLLGMFCLCVGVALYYTTPSEYFPIASVFAMKLQLVILVSLPILFLEIMSRSKEDFAKTNSQNELALAFLSGLLYPVWKVGGIYL